MYHDKDKGKLVLSNPIDFMTEWDIQKVRKKKKDGNTKKGKTDEELKDALLGFANAVNASFEKPNK